MRLTDTNVTFSDKTNESFITRNVNDRNTLQLKIFTVLYETPYTDIFHFVFYKMNF